MVIGYGPRFADFSGGGPGAAIFPLPRGEDVEPIGGNKDRVEGKIGFNRLKVQSGWPQGSFIGVPEELRSYPRTHFGLFSAVRCKCLNVGPGEVAKWQTRMP